MNKKKILLLSLASLLLVSCGTKHLTKEEALLRAETMKEKVENVTENITLQCYYL